MTGDVSRGILALAESEKMTKIEKAWFGEPGTCRSLSSSTMGSSSNLSFQSFSGLFIITGLASSLMLLVYLATFAYRELDQIRAVEPTIGYGSVLLRWLCACLKIFGTEDELRSPTFSAWNNESLRNGNKISNRALSPRSMGEGSQRNGATSSFDASVRSEMNAAYSLEQTPSSDVLGNSFEHDEEGGNYDFSGDGNVIDDLF
jgi:hypothetical protein